MHKNYILYKKKHTHLKPNFKKPKFCKKFFIDKQKNQKSAKAEKLYQKLKKPNRFSIMRKNTTTHEKSKLSSYCQNKSKQISKEGCIDPETESSSTTRGGFLSTELEFFKEIKQNSGLFNEIYKLGIQ